MTELDWDVKPELSELAHHGVKGMKWGVRTGGVKDRAKGAVDDSFQRRIVSNKAIAEGNAKTRDRVRSALTTPTGLIPSKKIAARRVRILEDRRARFSEGKATAGDVLSAVGHTPINTMFVSRRDKRGADVSNVSNVKQFNSVHEARKEAGVQFTEGKKQAELMSTKLSDAHATRKSRSPVTGRQAATGAAAIAGAAALGAGLGKALGG